MRNKTLVLAALASATLLAGGCAHETLRDGFGDSTQANIAAQLVNAEAGTAPAANTIDGQKVEKALGRYRNDKAESTRGKLLSDVGN